MWEGFEESIAEYDEDLRTDEDIFEFRKPLEQWVQLYLRKGNFDEEGEEDKRV